ncbi:MAG TPA: MFS transporter [Candidatus Dormibacteraeota bacterium]|nr:MFS transporter [Candidatus Dormibacteraeota bacterium]
METTRMTRRSAAARLDRLPITSYHRYVVWILGFVFFSELACINTFSFAAPAILKQWHISIAMVGYLVSATFLGMFLGAVSGGWFSDRVGRKRALILTTVWFSLFSLLNSVVWEPTGLFIARLLTGVGLSAMTVVGITYVSEMFPAKKRGAYQGWIMTVGLVGIPATAYVARFSIPIAPWGWRLVFVWGGLGLIFAALMAMKFEESPRWYENRGLLAEADAVMDRIETRARAEFGDLPPVPESAPVATRRGGYGEFFAPAYLPRTIMLLVTWIAQTLGFYGFMAWVPTLLVAHGVSIVHSLAWSSAISIGAVPGALIAALIAERWERKWSISGTTLVIAFCGLMYGLTFKTAAIIIFGFCVAMFTQTFVSLIYAYTAECYPTEIRNSGTGLTYGVGRLANVFGPLIVASLYTSFGYTSVFVFIAAMWLVVAVTIGIFGPLTKGRTLA